MVSCAGQTKAAYPFVAANFLHGDDSDVLKVFPFKGQAATIPLPLRLGRATFGPDGRSVYGPNATQPERQVTLETSGLSKIEFNSAS